MREDKVSLSDDELAAWWAADGSVSRLRGRIVTRIAYSTQSDREFVQKVCDEVSKRGMACRIEYDRTTGAYHTATGQRASIFSFDSIVIPRCAKIPEKKCTDARSALDWLKKAEEEGFRDNEPEKAQVEPLQKISLIADHSLTWWKDW